MITLCKAILLGCAILLCATQILLGQQGDVPRYETFASPSVLSIPKLNLMERGFNVELGANLTPWLTIGGDFSSFSGEGSLAPSDLSPGQQAKLGAVAPLLPSTMSLSFLYSGSTYTFSAGPQLALRRLKRITILVRPGLGYFHQTVTMKPSDSISSVIVNQLLGPGGRTRDTVLFYGFGGGIDVQASRQVAFRLTCDFAHANPFRDLLNGANNTVRISVGPTFRWGRNIASGTK
jgi:hypothetical protein